MSTTTYNSITAPGLGTDRFSLYALAARVHALLAQQDSRRALGRLEAHQLADLGISREEARAEAAKPFWIR